MVWDDEELDDKEPGGEAQGALGSRDVRARVLGCPVEAHGCPARVLLGGTALRLLCSSQAPLCSSGGGRWQARCWRHHPTFGPTAEQPVATELLSSQLLALPSSQLLLFSTSIFVLQVLKVL